MIWVLFVSSVILAEATYLAPSFVTVIFLGAGLAILWIAGASGGQVAGVLVGALVAGLVFKRLDRKPVKK